MIERLFGENTPHETRRESNETVDREKRYAQILGCLDEYGPMTALELAVKLNERGYIPTPERNYTAPRLTEMSEKGLVEPIGRKRCQYTGKNVSVYDRRAS